MCCPFYISELRVLSCCYCFVVFEFEAHREIEFGAVEAKRNRGRPQLVCTLRRRRV